MKWIYLSPHLDDAVFSCGGLIAQQSRLGDTVEVWTLCAGDPPDELLSSFAQELHQRWGNAAQAVAQRRLEDEVACHIVGAAPIHFPIPDAIYRRAGLDCWSAAESNAPLSTSLEFLYPDREAIFREVHPAEGELVDQTAIRLGAAVRTGTHLICPLTVGGHVDHRLTLAIARRMTSNLWYYADYPYAGELYEQVGSFVPDGWQKHVFSLSDADMESWVSGVSAYRSQISSFWENEGEMRADLRKYIRNFGGATLWRRW